MGWGLEGVVQLRVTNEAVGDRNKGVKEAGKTWFVKNFFLNEL